MASSTFTGGTYPYNKRYAGIIQHNPETNEPFIALPHPYSNIRLTPPRLSDAEDILAIMNNFNIVVNFAGPPYPYLREHCDGWLRERVREYEDALVHMTNGDGDIGLIDSSPLRHIREVGPDGTETFLGEVSLTREDVFCEIRDEEARTARVNVNVNLPPGDPHIVWTFGDYLQPTHHGRGIMTTVVRTVIDKWAIPHMNAYRFWAAAFPENIASHKVFLKNGFEIVDRVVGAVQFPQSKGGLVRDSVVFHRNIPIPIIS